MEGNLRDPYYDWRGRVGSDTKKGLMQTEVKFVAATHSKGNDYKRFRKSAVEFIEKQSRSYSFDALIPYMAMTYVDRFHLHGEIPHVVDPPERDVNLFLISCLTIAWKLRSKIFLLSGFLNERNLDCTPQEVLNMELHICRRLGWQIRTVTPFCFLDFFVPLLGLLPGSPSPLRSVRQLIIKSQFDIAFTEFRPSVLAAAAMLTVYQKMFGHNQYMAFAAQVVIFIHPHMEDVSKCKRMLMPLYKDPSVPAAAESKAAPGESSSSVVRQQSDTIPVPGKGTPTADPVKEKEMILDQFLQSLPPNSNALQELVRFHWQMIVLEEEDRKCRAEEEQIQREGKQHVASDETSPETEERHELVEEDPIELMGFELGWIEAQAEADRRGEGSGTQGDTTGDVPAGRPSGSGSGSGSQADTTGDVPAGERADPDTQADTRGDVPAGRDDGFAACLGPFWQRCCDIL